MISLEAGLVNSASTNMAMDEKSMTSPISLLMPLLRNYFTTDQTGKLRLSGTVRARDTREFRKKNCLKFERRTLRRQKS